MNNETNNPEFDNDITTNLTSDLRVISPEILERDVYIFNTQNTNGDIINIKLHSPSMSVVEENIKNDTFGIINKKIVLPLVGSGKIVETLNNLRAQSIDILYMKRDEWFNGFDREEIEHSMIDVMSIDNQSIHIRIRDIQGLENIENSMISINLSFQGILFYDGKFMNLFDLESVSKIPSNTKDSPESTNSEAMSENTKHSDTLEPSEIKIDDIIEVEELPIENLTESLTPATTLESNDKIDSSEESETLEKITQPLENKTSEEDVSTLAKTENNIVEPENEDSTVNTDYSTQTPLGASTTTDEETLEKSIRIVEPVQETDTNIDSNPTSITTITDPVEESVSKSITEPVAESGPVTKSVVESEPNKQELSEPMENTQSISLNHSSVEPLPESHIEEPEEKSETEEISEVTDTIQVGSGEYDERDNILKLNENSKLFYKLYILLNENIQDNLMQQFMGKISDMNIDPGLLIEQFQNEEKEFVQEEYFNLGIN